MRTIYCTLIVLIASVTQCAGQTDAVFLVKMFDCGPSKEERAQTGFLLLGKRGLITALHGVADCADDFTARNNGNLVITRLKRARVDVDRDLVILDSPDLNQFSSFGLIAANGVSWEGLKSVWVYGYPRETKLEGRPISVLAPAVKPLSAALPPNPPELRRALELRASPSHLIRILHLADGLVPGHSGAPVLDGQSRVIAVADGGLKNVGTSWAIPLEDAEWEDAPGNERVAQLAGLKLGILFASERGPDMFGGTLLVVADATCTVTVRGRDQLLAKGTEGSWSVTPGLVHIHAATHNGIEDVADVQVPLGSPAVWRTRLLEPLNRTLVMAIRAGDSVSMSESLSAGADPIAATDDGKFSAISLAASLDRPQLLRVLLSKSMPLNVKDPGGCTPLARAIQNRRSENAVMLLRAGSPIDVCNDPSPLRTAIAQGDSMLVTALIQAGADPYEKDKDNSTVFDAAIDSGSPDVIKAFVSSGRIRKGDGIQRALQYRHNPSALRALVEAGAVQDPKELFCGQWVDYGSKNDKEVIPTLRGAGYDCKERQQQVLTELPQALAALSTAINSIGAVNIYSDRFQVVIVKGIQECQLALDARETNKGYTIEQHTIILRLKDFHPMIYEVSYAKTVEGFPMPAISLYPAKVSDSSKDPDVYLLLMGSTSTANKLEALFLKATDLCRLDDAFNH